MKLIVLIVLSISLKVTQQISMSEGIDRRVEAYCEEIGEACALSKNAPVVGHHVISPGPCAGGWPSIAQPPDRPYDPGNTGGSLSAREQRRLAAIVSADVVGYSRLMDRDESGTLARLRERRQKRLQSVLARRGGSIVRLTDLLDEAIRLKPDDAVVHGFVAWCHEQRYLRGGLRVEAREAARYHAHAAIKAGAGDAMALAMGGFVVAVVARDDEMALEALDRSLALSPSSALAFGFSAIVRARLGEDSTAIEHARLGIRLSPYDPLVYLPYVGLAHAHFFAGNFVEAASAAKRASVANPRVSVPCYLHTAALVRLGRRDEANSMAKRLLELQPGFTISGLASGNITTPERMMMLADALRHAGLRE